MKTIRLRVHPIDNDHSSMKMNDCEVSFEGTQRGGKSFDIYLADEEISQIRATGKCPHLTDAVGSPDYCVEFDEEKS